MMSSCRPLASRVECPRLDLFLQHSKRFFDYHITGCFDPENNSGLVDVVAYRPACINARNLEGQCEAGPFGSDYPFAFLLDNESSSDCRQTLDVMDQKLAG